MTAAKILEQIKLEGREDARFGTRYNPYIVDGDEYKAYEEGYSTPVSSSKPYAMIAEE